LTNIRSPVVYSFLGDRLTLLGKIHLDNMSILSKTHLAQREIPSAYCYDDHNQLRVIAEPITFANVVDAAFNQIRQYGQSSVAVTMRLLEAIATIAAFTHRPTDRIALRHHAEMVERGSQTEISEESDLNDIKERYLAALKAIGQA
jgi:uncharacterized membrane protein